MQADIEPHTNNMSIMLQSLHTHVAELALTLDRMERELERYSPPQRLPVASQSAGSDFGYELWGQRFSARNGNDVLVSILRHCAELFPEFPERYSRAVKTLGRKRPYVARNVEDIYPGKPGLQKFTEAFAPGWYVGTNESNEKKLQLLRVACRTLGIRFGKDLKVRM